MEPRRACAHQESFTYRHVHQCSVCVAWVFRRIQYSDSACHNLTALNQLALMKPRITLLLCEAFRAAGAQLHVNDVHEPGDADGVHLLAAHQVEGHTGGHVAWLVSASLVFPTSTCKQAVHEVLTMLLAVSLNVLRTMLLSRLPFPLFASCVCCCTSRCRPCVSPRTHPETGLILQS